MYQALTLFLAAATLPLAAQWLDHPDPRTPRGKDGKPNLAAPAPQRDGKPDLSGVWQVERTPPSEFVRALGEEMVKVEIDLNDITKHMINFFWDVKREEEPLRPEARAFLKQRQENPPPAATCLPTSLPSALFILTFKLVQAPGLIVMLPEGGDPPRQIHLDGRPLPKDPNPSWMGYSTARWEGDELVVESNGFTDRAPLDLVGHPRSEAMRLTERYRRRDFGHMDLEITVEDPTYYTRPYTIHQRLQLIPDTDVLEYVCAENERDRAHIVQ